MLPRRKQKHRAKVKHGTAVNAPEDALLHGSGAQRGTIEDVEPNAEVRVEEKTVGDTEMPSWEQPARGKTKS